jgi:predicted RNA-binding Zn-ribbon protein involved in translation (DUF1610 family)
MSATCPMGHQSATTDYCDQCGALITRSSDPGATTELSIDPVTEPAPATAAQACPKCGTTRVGHDQFCEECGYDFVARSGGAPGIGVAPSASTWEVVVTADRAYFESLETDDVRFPSNYVPRRFVLDGQEVRVGRGSASRNVAPEIDLSNGPEDTGISHLHLQFVQGDDGSYAVIDLDSTNGTTVNDGAPISPGAAVALAHGDRIHLGAWTLITVHCTDGAPSA